MLHDFVPIIRAEEMMQLIRAQQASGGGDAPEDVLSGAVGCLGLSWASHLRMVIHGRMRLHTGTSAGAATVTPPGRVPTKCRRTSLCRKRSSISPWIAGQTFYFAEFSAARRAWSA